MTIQMTTSEIRTEILKRLETAVRRDIEKDGTDVISAGLRSTVDIAGYLYPKIPVSKVSRILDSMCLDGEIEWYGKIDGLGNVSFWRLASDEVNDGDGEPVIIDLQAVRDNCLTQASIDAVASSMETDFDYWFPVAA
jgi:hypothetical protein